MHVDSLRDRVGAAITERLSAESAVGALELGVRYGRQEFTDGSALLIGTRDFNSIRFVVNGVRAWANGSKVRARSSARRMAFTRCAGASGAESVF